MELGGYMKTTVSNSMRIMKVNLIFCIVWRNGVGDAAINQVAQQEIPTTQ